MVISTTRIHESKTPRLKLPDRKRLCLKGPFRSSTLASARPRVDAIDPARDLMVMRAANAESTTTCSPYAGEVESQRATPTNPLKAYRMALADLPDSRFGSYTDRVDRRDSSSCRTNRSDRIHTYRVGTSTSRSCNYRRWRCQPCRCGSCRSCSCSSISCSCSSWRWRCQPCRCGLVGVAR